MWWASRNFSRGSNTYSYDVRLWPKADIPTSLHKKGGEGRREPGGSLADSVRTSLAGNAILIGHWPQKPEIRPFSAGFHCFGGSLPLPTIARTGIVPTGWTS
jgi:hypothetical protein